MPFKTAAVRPSSLNIGQPSIRTPPEEDITPLLNHPTRGQSVRDADPADPALPSIGRGCGHLSTFGSSAWLSVSKARGRGTQFGEHQPSKQKSAITARSRT